MFEWNLHAVLTLLLAGLWIGAAGLVFFTRPERLPNRLLAAMLFTEGAAWVANGLWLTTADPILHRALVLTDWTAWFLVPILYLVFLRTLPTPLARPLRKSVTLAAIIAVGLAFQLALRVSSDSFYVGARAGRLGAPLDTLGGPGITIFIFFFAAVCLYALVVAVSAWHRAPAGSMQRRQAGSYAIAFGIRDASIIAFVAYAMVVRTMDLSPHPIAGAFWAIQAAVFVVLLTYGILRNQILEIDLKVKWTLQRGTVAAIFLAAFFVVGTVAQEFLADTLGWALGGVTAGLLIFAIMPLYRFAERLSNKAMPGVQDTEEYRRVRKQEVYRATFEEMFADGNVTAKERRALLRLQEQLGLDAVMAQRVELEILEARELV